MCEYKEFCMCMKNWNEWFDSENSRCMVCQVQYLLLDTFMFKLLQKAYELSDTELVNGQEIKKQNQMLHWFIDRNYVNSVIMDIRRLLDRNESTVSLKILLGEMKGKDSLLTRENYANKFGDFVNLSEHKDEYSRKTSANASRYNPGDEIEFKERTDPFVLKYDEPVPMI